MQQDLTAMPRSDLLQYLIGKCELRVKTKWFERIHGKGERQGENTQLLSHLMIVILESPLLFLKTLSCSSHLVQQLELRG